MKHLIFSKTTLSNIPAIYPDLIGRGLGRKIHFKTAPKSPEGDLKLLPYRITFLLRVLYYLIPTTYYVFIFLVFITGIFIDYDYRAKSEIMLLFFQFIGSTKKNLFIRIR